VRACLGSLICQTVDFGAACQPISWKFPVSRRMVELVGLLGAWSLHSFQPLTEPSTPEPTQMTMQLFQKSKGPGGPSSRSTIWDFLDRGSRDGEDGEDIVLLKKNWKHVISLMEYNFFKEWEFVVSFKHINGFKHSSVKNWTSNLSYIGKETCNKVLLSCVLQSLNARFGDCY